MEHGAKRKKDEVLSHKFSPSLPLLSALCALRFFIESLYPLSPARSEESFL
jgi:hypothetical protein